MSARQGPKEAQCTIVSLNHDGAGVGRSEGKVVFVDGALPGEEVRFRYTARKRRYDIGVAQEIMTASPERVAPRCEYFGVCGGCCLQHLDAEAQLRAKEGIVREAMAHIAKVGVEEWAPPLSGPVYGYRRKARLGARVVDKKGGLLVGFRERRRSYITPLLTCQTLDARMGLKLAPLKGLLERLSRPESIPQVEFAAGDLSAALVLRHVEPLTDTDRERITAFGREHGFSVYGQSGGPDTVSLMGGEALPLRYALPEFDVDLEFGPGDFVQVNAVANRAMVKQAVDWLDVRKDSRVLDLFCGLGNFTLPLGRRAQTVLGVEGAAALVERGLANARRHGLTHIEFAAADLDVFGLDTLLEDRVWDRALLDPPRTGALAAVGVLAKRGVPRIVYVSCNPATLARDADVLVHQFGYRLTRAGVIDMFPHTHHIETMALFERDL